MRWKPESQDACNKNGGTIRYKAMKDLKNILVVGGAGYIGSHCVRLLDVNGFHAVVLDNLVYGHLAAVADGVTFYEGDMSDSKLVSEILIEHEIEAVMHFGAFAYVGESVKQPMKYYRNNVANTLLLLETMVSCNVRKFIFSSTCATYGEPEALPIDENFTQKPINPYGQTKLDIENCLKSLAHAGEMNSAVFRYFNAAGAASDSSIGECHDPETHLIPLAIDAALGRREALQVFGSDFRTKDGTCLRDYVHVDDIARAHISVISKMHEGSGFQHYNLGTGNPTSVLEVIAAVEKATSMKVPFEYSERREGDPEALYADASKARRELAWEAEYNDIDAIVESAWTWHKAKPNGYYQE